MSPSLAQILTVCNLFALGQFTWLLCASVFLSVKRTTPAVSVVPGTSLLLGRQPRLCVWLCNSRVTPEDGVVLYLFDSSRS